VLAIRARHYCHPEKSFTKLTRTPSGDEQLCFWEILVQVYHEAPAWGPGKQTHSLCLQSPVPGSRPKNLKLTFQKLLRCSKSAPAPRLCLLLRVAPDIFDPQQHLAIAAHPRVRIRSLKASNDRGIRSYDLQKTGQRSKISLLSVTLDMRSDDGANVCVQTKTAASQRACSRAR
jgi:hypothetical protein